MPHDFRKMWTELGLNLDLHDELMASMSRAHEKTHFSQKNRPEKMDWFDRALHASHADRVAEIVDYREKGGKCIGTFCIYVPDEIALAADVLPVPLCGGSNWSSLCRIYRPSRLQWGGRTTSLCHRRDTIPWWSLHHSPSLNGKGWYYIPDCPYV